MLAGRSDWHYASMQDGKMGSQRFARLAEVYDMENRRPNDQWWMALLDVMSELARRPADLEH